jgi:hypothetical protein
MLDCPSSSTQYSNSTVNSRNISLWEILRDSFAIFCNAVMPNTFKHGMTPTHQAKQKPQPTLDISFLKPTDILYGV